MKTLHTAYRVSDIDRSLAFYGGVGFIELGRVTVEDGRLLVMLRLPDDDAVTLELVLDPRTPVPGAGGFSHLVVQVDDFEAMLARLRRAGIDFEPPWVPDGEDGMKTSFIEDPDGYRIELVQWPPGHADGMTEADFQ
jgi:lactoylglutathione lyase